MQYIKDFLMSRGYEEWDYIPCELCHWHWVDIHHINSSYRGKRKHNKDGSDLIALCRRCHDGKVHSNNNMEMREMLLSKVQNILLKKKNEET